MRILLFGLLILTMWSCEKSPEDLLAEQDEQMQAYINAHNLDATKTSSGLYYVITEEGNGNFPSANSRIKVKYTGQLLDGSVFDSGTINDGALNQFITGWTEGIQYFDEGAVGKLIIPSYLGYGSRKAGSIPENSVLIFDINLIKIL